MKCCHKYLYVPPQNGYIGIYTYMCYHCNKQKTEVKSYKILFSYYMSNIKNSLINLTNLFRTSSRYKLFG